MPWQRIVLLLSLLVTAVCKLTEWLSGDYLSFAFLFLQEEGRPTPLGAERRLLEMLLRKAIASGTVRLERVSAADAAQRVALSTRRSQCQALALVAEDGRHDVEGMTVGRLTPEGPALGWPRTTLRVAEGENGLQRWAKVLEELLQAWL
jgi:hypothetical protein